MAWSFNRKLMMLGSALFAVALAGMPACSCGDCPEGQEMCGDVCVPTDWDADHCGECDNACGSGENCIEGSCTAESSCEDFNKTDCGGTCVDTQHDPGYCGDCDTSCAAGEFCDNGVCTSGCASPMTECGSACVDTRNDPDNCGGCDTTCEDGELCVAGTCETSGTCADFGLTDCGGVCYDTDVDPMHCGDCTTECGAAESCVLGVCGGASCESYGLTTCDSMCVDTENNPSYCGSCSTECVAGEICVNSICTPVGSCESLGLGTCQVGGVDTCVDTDNDPAHCGDCTTTCDVVAGESCQDGVCGCSAGLEVCGGDCVNTQLDPANCGACGTICAAGEVCYQGGCSVVPCSDLGLTDCNSSCVDTSNNPSFCGSCTTVCGAEETCSNSQCVCAGGLTSCGGDCVNTDTAHANCGACGTPCGSSQVCTGGDCVTATIDHIVVTCDALSVPDNQQTQCHASAIYAAGSGVPPRDVTTEALWFDDDAAADVVTTGDDIGLVDVDGEPDDTGEVWVWYAGFSSAHVTITVIDTAICGVKIVPWGEDPMTFDGSQPFYMPYIATGPDNGFYWTFSAWEIHYAQTCDVGEAFYYPASQSQEAWNSSDPAVATVTPAVHSAWVEVAYKAVFPIADATTNIGLNYQSTYQDSVAVVVVPVTNANTTLEAVPAAFTTPAGWNSKFQFFLVFDGHRINFTTYAENQSHGMGGPNGPGNGNQYGCDEDEHPLAPGNVCAREEEPIEGEQLDFFDIMRLPDAETYQVWFWVKSNADASATTLKLELWNTNPADLTPIRLDVPITIDVAYPIHCSLCAYPDGQPYWEYSTDSLSSFMDCWEMGFFMGPYWTVAGQPDLQWHAWGWFSDGSFREITDENWGDNWQIAYGGSPGGAGTIQGFGDADPGLYSSPMAVSDPDVADIRYVFDPDLSYGIPFQTTPGYCGLSTYWDLCNDPWYNDPNTPWYVDPNDPNDANDPGFEDRLRWQQFWDSLYQACPDRDDKTVPQNPLRPPEGFRVHEPVLCGFDVTGRELTADGMMQRTQRWYEWNYNSSLVVVPNEDGWTQEFFGVASWGFIPMGSYENWCFHSYEEAVPVADVGFQTQKSLTNWLDPNTTRGQAQDLVMSINAQGVGTSNASATFDDRVDTLTGALAFSRVNPRDYAVWRWWWALPSPEAFEPNDPNEWPFNPCGPNNPWDPEVGCGYIPFAPTSCAAGQCDDTLWIEACGEAQDTPVRQASPHPYDPNAPDTYETYAGDTGSRVYAFEQYASPDTCSAMGHSTYWYGVTEEVSWSGDRDEVAEVNDTLGSKGNVDAKLEYPTPVLFTAEWADGGTESVPFRVTGPRWSGLELIPDHDGADPLVLLWSIMDPTSLPDPNSPDGWTAAHGAFSVFAQFTDGAAPEDVTNAGIPSDIRYQICNNVVAPDEVCERCDVLEIPDPNQPIVRPIHAVDVDNATPGEGLCFMRAYCENCTADGVGVEFEGPDCQGCGVSTNDLVSVNMPVVTSERAELGGLFIQKPTATCYDPPAEDFDMFLISSGGDWDNTRLTDIDMYACLWYTNGTRYALDHIIEHGASYDPVGVSWGSEPLSVVYPGINNNAEGDYTETHDGRLTVRGCAENLRPCASAAQAVIRASIPGNIEDTITVTYQPGSATSVTMGQMDDVDNCPAGLSTIDYCSVTNVAVQFTLSASNGTHTMDITTHQGYDNAGNGTVFIGGPDYDTMPDSIPGWWDSPSASENQQIRGEIATLASGVLFDEASLNVYAVDTYDALTYTVTPDTLDWSDYSTMVNGVGVNKVMATITADDPDSHVFDVEVTVFADIIPEQSQYTRVANWHTPSYRDNFFLLPSRTTSTISDLDVDAVWGGMTDTATVTVDP